MPALPKPRHEMFAHGCAEGLRRLAARKALAIEGLAALKTGGNLLKAVTDLKRRLPPDAEPFEREEAPMSPEEWIKTFNPPA